MVEPYNEIPLSGFLKKRKELHDNKGGSKKIGGKNSHRKEYTVYGSIHLKF